MMGVIDRTGMNFTLQSIMFAMTFWGGFEALFYSGWNAKTDAEQMASI